jgi:hypothetical protein
MRYKEIKNPPHNEEDYTTVVAGNGQVIFEVHLMNLLREQEQFIKTDKVPIIWASKAMEFAHLNNYEVKVLKDAAPSDLGGELSSIGKCYFRRRKDTPLRWI